MSDSCSLSEASDIQKKLAKLIKDEGIEIRRLSFQTMGNQDVSYFGRTDGEGSWTLRLKS